MLIPGKQIVQGLAKELAEEIKKAKRKTNHIVISAILVQQTPSIIARKKTLAKKLGIDIQSIRLPVIPSFESFMHTVKEQSSNPEVSGVIIQKPLPPQLSTESLFDFIAVDKEIEGHHKKTTYFTPIGLAIVTILKYIYGSSTVSRALFVDVIKDRTFFKRAFKNKKVVLLGCNTAEGIAIGSVLNAVKINYFCLNINGSSPNEFLKEADIIISTVGEKTITPDLIKQGVTLINIKEHKNGTQIAGDYVEKEIKNIAGFYTPITGFLQELEALYLFRNCISRFV